MKVRWRPTSLGTDDDGTEAIGFGFEPDLTTEGATRWQLTTIWILGIHMTKFGKHPDKDTVDLARRGRAWPRSPTAA